MTVDMTARSYADVEIAMQVFRLLRDGGYTKAEDLIAAIRRDFPTEPEDRLMRVMGRVCRKALEGIES